MGSLPVSTHRGRVPWQGLLLAVSLFTFWSPPATAQLAIVSTNAAEGEDVLLRMRNQPPEAVAFLWYRGEETNRKSIIAFFAINLRSDIKGPAYSGRERINYDGSLLIQNVTVNDTGAYTVVVYVQDLIKEIGFGRLTVYEPVRAPTLLASSTTGTENKDTVVLTCYTNAVSTQWFFNGMDLQLTERRKLSQDHRSLTIDPVEREDAGIYQCKASNPISSAESWPVVLDVKFE